MFLRPGMGGACRDGLKQFEDLNKRLKAKDESRQYHFNFLSPEDYMKFFKRIKANDCAGWRSTLIQELNA